MEVDYNRASTVFADENARLKHDPDHSQMEDRFVLLPGRMRPFRKEAGPYLAILMTQNSAVEATGYRRLTADVDERKDLRRMTTMAQTAVRFAKVT